MTKPELDPTPAVSAETLRARAEALWQGLDDLHEAIPLSSAIDSVEGIALISAALDAYAAQVAEDAVARARVEARAEWQPIASAPTGKPVLVYLNGTANLGIYRAILAQWYKDEMPQWRPVGYTRLDEFATDACITHWMPLPDPPVAGHA